MNTSLDLARRRVERSRWIPVYLLGLLLAYGCVAHRNAVHYRGETATPSLTLTSSPTK